MVVITHFGPGDTVRVGPHEGRIQRVLIGHQSVSYVVGYWNEDRAPVEYVAYEWELTLVEKMPSLEKES